MCVVFTEAAPVRNVVFLEILQNSQKNTCVRVSFLIRPATLLKKRFWHKCFSVNFAKFLRTLFLQTTSERLLLFLFFLQNEEIVYLVLTAKHKKYWTSLSEIYPTVESEAAFGGVLRKKMFLEILPNSQENTCARESF